MMQPLTRTPRRRHQPPKNAWLHTVVSPALLFPAMALVLLVVTWSLALTLIRSEREAVEREAILSSQQLVSTYEALMVRALREIDGTLRILQFAHTQAGVDYLQALDERSLLPPSLLFTVIVTDAAGNVIFSNSNDGLVSFASREDFATLRSADVLIISEPESIPSDEEPVVHFGRRLVGADGEFTGAAYVTAGINYFVANYQTLQLGELGLLALLRDDDTVIAAREGADISTGNVLDLSSLDFSQAPAADPVVIQRTAALDGVERFIAALELFEFPLTIVVGLSVEEVLAPFRETRRLYLASATMASVVVVALLTLLGSQSHRLEAARRQALASERAHSAEVEHLALHDALTGLPNRILFAQLVNQGIRIARRRRTGLAVLFLDLDHFKDINDTLGHDAGDEMLKETGDRLRGCFRKSDTIARFGGDEFVALVPDLAARADAELLAAKILEALKKPYKLAGESRQVTSSIGIALYPEDGDDDVTLLKKADIAMYEAKQGGRDRFVFFNDLPGEQKAQT